MRPYQGGKVRAPFWFFGLGLLLTGCQSLTRVDPEDAVAVSEAVNIAYDDFRGTTTTRGPTVENTVETDGNAPEVEEIALRSRTERDRPTRYFLDVTDYYQGDWRGFDQAFDRQGNKFHALTVRHHVDCPLLCGFDEALEIELPVDYLRIHADSGITLRLYGPSGAASAPFTLPAAYVQGFLRGAYADVKLTPPHR